MDWFIGTLSLVEWARNRNGGFAAGYLAIVLKG